MNNDLNKKIDFALKLLQSYAEKADKIGQPLEICYSGGKDSDVILELAKMSAIPFRAIYKNTTIDPPGTISHCKQNDVEIFEPKMSFSELIAKKGFPSSSVRFCCQILKEYKILDYAVLGIRRDESAKRKERYQEPDLCRVYSAKDKCIQIFPILYWTTEDIKTFIQDRNIHCHPTYYDEHGTFHPERRLGCLACPISSKKNRIADFKKYPKLLKLYAKQGDIYRNKHPNVSNLKTFKSVYDWICFTLFCSSLEEFNRKFGKNLFDNGIDCKSFLENYFKVTL